MAELPLKGVRVLDLTVVWAGPYGATLLADMGAEVIRIESIQTMPPLTRGTLAHPPQALIQIQPPFSGGFPDRQVGDHPWNRSPIFNSHGRNKLSMTVDLRVPLGKGIFERLLQVSDVFIDNNVRETTDKLGITYDALRAVKEDIIMVRMPAYGDEGAYSGYRALGVHMADALGHGLVRGYADMDPSANTGEFVVDASAGTHAAAAVLMALLYRRRTGRGQLIELPSSQATFGYFAHSFMERTMAGRTPSTLGNRDAAALQGCYPCRGEDRWIVITLADDRHWEALRRALGDPEWARLPEFQDHAGRYRNHDALDRHISDWTREREHREAMRVLQEARVPAGAVLDARDAVEDPHLGARGFYQEATTADTGTYRYPSAPFRLSETPARVRRGPVMLGQDNEYVYKEVLGLSDDEYAELVREGHIGTEFRSDIP